MNAAPIFRRVALIGFGLIGGSIARAARAQGLASEIVTTARSEKTRARVAELGGAFAAGLTSAGVVACYKHFPGHGGTRADSHLELPRMEASASAACVAIR